MLYLLAEWLNFEGIFNLVRYQTFRAGATLMTALIIGLVIGPRFIAMLRVRQGKGQPIREDGPQTHLAKRGTPTMGGLMILISLSLSVLIWMDLSNPFIWACLAVTLGFGLIGFLDDYDKVSKASHKGVSGKVRLLLEFAIAGVASFIVVNEVNTFLYVPFFNDIGIELGVFYYAFAAFVIVGAGNAVNLTDGLDGLATMPVIIAAGTFALIAYLVGRVDYSDYLGIPYVEGAGELAIFCAAIMGVVSSIAASIRSLAFWMLATRWKSPMLRLRISSTTEPTGSLADETSSRHLLAVSSSMLGHAYLSMASD